MSKNKTRVSVKYLEKAVKSYKRRLAALKRKSIRYYPNVNDVDA